MNPNDFYTQVLAAAALPPADRHCRFVEIHTQVADDYCAAVARLDAAAAAQPCSAEDPRTLAQVVGHIAAWERFLILSAGELLAGVERPRLLAGLEGYLEPDGTPVSFAGIDEFNAYQRQQQANLPWETIQAFALETARTLQAVFAHPALLTAERLERTRPGRKRLDNGALIPDIRLGWVIWLIVLEHAGVEHAAALGIAGA